MRRWDSGIKNWDSEIGNQKVGTGNRESRMREEVLKIFPNVPRRFFWLKNGELKKLPQITEWNYRR